MREKKRSTALYDAIMGGPTPAPDPSIPLETFERLFQNAVENEALKELRRLRAVVRKSTDKAAGLQRPGPGRPRADQTLDFWQESFRLGWAVDVLGLPKAEAFRIVTGKKAKRGLSASDYRWLNDRLSKYRQELDANAKKELQSEAHKYLLTLPLKTRRSIAKRTLFNH